MASHRHHHNSHCPTCCCCCSCSSSSNPPPSLSDSLVQILASHLLQSLPSQPPNFHYLKQQQDHHQHCQQNHTQQHHQQQDSRSLLLLQSLLRRVAALESSLHHLSCPSSHPSPSSSPSPSPPPPALSLRDLAARTIQTGFRAFLVRRSQTLRNLKDLAAIKSRFASLKSSLLDNTRLDPYALAQKASDLLIQLDSIQSRDSLIREGKRAIRCELVRFLESVEGSQTRRQSNLPPKPKKKVNFAEDVSAPCAEALEEGFGGFSSVVETEDNGAHLHHQISGERNPTRNFMAESNPAIGTFFRGQNGILNLRSPLSLKPEEVSYGINGSFDFHHPRVVAAKGAEFSYGMNGVGYAPTPLTMNGEETLAGGNFGLSAPVPVQMEKRGGDLLKERAFDIPRKR